MRMVASAGSRGSTSASPGWPSTSELRGGVHHRDVAAEAARAATSRPLLATPARLRPDRVARRTTRSVAEGSLILCCSDETGQYHPAVSLGGTPVHKWLEQWFSAEEAQSGGVIREAEGRRSGHASLPLLKAEVEKRRWHLIEPDGSVRSHL